MQLPTRSVVVAAVLAGWLLLSAVGCGPGAGEQAAAAQGEPAPGGARRVARPGAPNVLLVVIDTLRADHLDLYGYGRRTAPRLAAMAATGVTFLEAFSQAKSTVPSHATMFTGRYPSQHRTTGYKTPLPGSEETMAESFLANGWRSFGVASSERFESGSGFRQGFESFELARAADGADRAAEATRLALQRIAASDERPFFGFVHYMQPHLPYSPPENLATRFHPGYEELTPRQTGQFVNDYDGSEADMPAEAVAWLEGLYDAEILALDEQLGAFLDALDEMGVAGNTLLVLTADHGEEFREHGMFQHRQLYTEVLRVPLVVRWPDRLPAGGVVQRPVELAGLLPTLADLVQLPLPEHATGRSFADELLPGSERAPEGRDARREALDRMDVVYSEINSDRKAVAATLPTGRFKLIRTSGSRIELYQVDEDPTERHEVSWAFPREVGLLTELAATIAPASEAQEQILRVPDAEARAWLIELGYVEETR